MTPCARFSIALFACVLPALAGAQVFRCADSAGKVQYSDRACDAGRQSSEVRIYKQPAAPAPRMSAQATTYEKERQQRRESGGESHRRADDATAEVRQIKDENRDPRKCAAARDRMGRMEQRDPMYKINIGYTMAQQQAGLYCGN